VDGGLAMAVLLAPLRVDIEMLETALEACRVRLATESEFRSKFPDCETGAMPPFGTLFEQLGYERPLLVDKVEESAFHLASSASSLCLPQSYEYLPIGRCTS
jgi:Ala-tRNA(Pro) deacylase